MIVLITGMMAAGKSTVARRVAERLERGVHLPGDVFRRMIVSGRSDMTADASDEALATAPDSAWSIRTPSLVLPCAR